MIHTSQKFCGLINNDNRDTVSLNKLYKMTSSLNYGGHFHDSLFINKNYGLVSLSLQKENNTLPQQNDDIYVAISGNIFNLREIAKKFKLNKTYSTDPKHILSALYKKVGTKFVSDLNGIFNISLFEKAKNKFVLFNDRYGARPLYYSRSKNGFIFSSNISSIYSSGGLKKSINWKAWSDFMYFGSINNNDTFFKEIECLPPGTILAFEKGSIRLATYWDSNNIKPRQHLNDKNIIEEGAFLMKQAVITQTSDLESACCLLSGGYDSRGLISLITNHSETSLITYTSQKEFGDRGDEFYSKKVAKAYELENTFIELPEDLYQKHYLDWFNTFEGQTSEHLWMLPLTNHIQKGLINFDGMGGDVIFGKKYIYFDDLLKYKENNDEQQLARAIIDRKKNIKEKTDHFIENAFQPDIGNILKKRSLEEIELDLTGINSHENKVSNYFLKNRIRRAIAQAPFNLLLNRCESRVPYLDNRLVDFALSLPLSYKNKMQIYKRILILLDKNIMALPSTNDFDLTKSLPSRKFFPDQLLQSQKYIKKLFNAYTIDNNVLHTNNNFLYPTSKYVHFHLWYNIFYKD